MHHCSIPIIFVQGITPLHSKELPDFRIWTDDVVIVVVVDGAIVVIDVVDFAVELIRDPMFLLVLALKIKKKTFLYLPAIVSGLVLFRMQYLMVLTYQRPR